MGCSQNYGPLLVVDYLAAPNAEGYQDGTLSLGTTTLNPTYIHIYIYLYLCVLIYIYVYVCSYIYIYNTYKT